LSSPPTPDFSASSSIERKYSFPKFADYFPLPAHTQTMIATPANRHLAGSPSLRAGCVRRITGSFLVAHRCIGALSAQGKLKKEKYYSQNTAKLHLTRLESAKRPQNPRRFFAIFVRKMPLFGPKRHQNETFISPNASTAGSLALTEYGRYEARMAEVWLGP
jgi:hypothetical protein